MLTPATHSSVATPFERLNRVTLTALLKAQLTSAQIHPAAVLWVLGLFGGCEPAISPFVNYIKDVYPPAPIVDLDMVKAIQKKLKYPDGKDDSKIKKLRLQLGQDLALALCDGADTSLYRIVVAVLRKHEDGEVRELTRDMLGALPGVKSCGSFCSYAPISSCLEALIMATGYVAYSSAGGNSRHLGGRCRNSGYSVF